MTVAARGGALDLALGIARRILAEPTRVDDSTLAEAVDIAVGCGEPDLAKQAEGLAERLRQTDRGTRVARLLGIPFPVRAWRLPSGKVDALAMALDLATHRVPPVEVVRWLSARPAELLRSPQLHLLVANAAFMMREASAANHAFGCFLTTFGLAGPLAIELDPENALRGFRWQPRASPDGPLITVIMAAYQAADTIEYALDSILRQRHENLEVLVCDDASQDLTVDRIRSYLVDPRVRLFRSTENQGTYNIRNALLPHARGEYVTYHDADDFALPDRLTRQIAALQSGDYLACVAHWIRLTPRGLTTVFHDGGILRRSVVSMLVRKEHLSASGPYRSALFGADHEMLEALIHGAPGRVVSLREPLLLGLWGTGSLTRQPGREALESGYRSPDRRRYTELVFRRYAIGDTSITDSSLDIALQATGNWRDPQGVAEVR